MNEFDYFFQEHHRIVYAYLKKLLRDPYLVEDLQQETFLRAFRVYAKAGEMPRPEKPWLLQIAKNLVVDQHRKNSQAVIDPSLVGDIFASTRNEINSSSVVVQGMELPRDQAHDLVHQGLQQLHPGYQSVLRSKYERGLACWEMAVQYGISVESAKIRLHRGRKRLRKFLLAKIQMEVEHESNRNFSS